MSNSKERLRDYILGDAYDGERLEILRTLEQDNFKRVINQVLAEYGLAQRLAAARTAPSKVQILDIGCAEGLFLHDLAQILEERELLASADLSGLDFDPVVIETAEAFSKVSQPPRPYLNFYLHDATQPFEESLGLRSTDKLQFDFIFIKTVLGFLPQASEHLQRFYAALKPGGVLYVRDVVTREGKDGGWVSVHPALEPFSRLLMSNVSSLNNQVEVAKETAGWLREMGAINVQARLDTTITGGTTSKGKQGLRNIVMLMRNMSPHLIRKGQITQSQYDELMEVLFRELGPHLQGQVSSIDTLAQKL